MEGYLNKIFLGDCLEIMPQLPDKCIDMILCDLPYGTTACSWDIVIPFELLWEQYKRLIKDNGAVVLTASQPFTSMLAMSNLDWFKYCWVWEKNKPTGFVHAKNKPLKAHEDICVFSPGTTVHKSQSQNRMIYNPQGIIKINKKQKHRESHTSSVCFEKRKSHKDYIQEYTNFPRSILKFKVDEKKRHPTQKPVALFEYLIKTYTNPGEIVLDNCAGSCTTAIACLNTNRNYICIEKEPKYCDIGRERVEKWHKKKPVNQQVSFWSD